MTAGGGVAYMIMVVAGMAIPIMAAMSAEVGQQGGAPTAAFAIFWLRRLLGHYWEKWTVPLLS